MNPLLFHCPNTERKVRTGIKIDIAVLRNVQPVTVRLLCPHCHGIHEWKLAEGLVEEPRPTPPSTLEAWSPCAR